jgi:hypothetical protein
MTESNTRCRYRHRSHREIIYNKQTYNSNYHILPDYVRVHMITSRQKLHFVFALKTVVSSLGNMLIQREPDNTVTGINKGARNLRQGSSAGMATDWTVEELRLFPVWQKIFISSIVSRMTLGPAQPPIQRRPGALSPGIKRQGRETDHSCPSSAKVKNGAAVSPLPPNCSRREFYLVMSYTHSSSPFVLNALPISPSLT